MQEMGPCKCKHNHRHQGIFHAESTPIDFSAKA